MDETRENQQVTYRLIVSTLRLFIRALEFPTDYRTLRACHRQTIEAC